MKLLAFSATGAFIAAPTTSLPEKLGGKLNWDYRYCWLRDASLTINALWDSGFHMEAQAFCGWMLQSTRLTQPKLMVMYDVYGNLAPDESELGHLAGYRGSRPVHIGNGARTQHQLDTYGEVICGTAKVLHHTKRADRETVRALTGFGRFVCAHWREPDAGIWEPRGEPEVHTHSRLLCWVALHELVELHEAGIFELRNIEAIKVTRAEIRTAIETECWNEQLGSYVAKPGAQALDATLLLLMWHGFEPATTSRARGTVRQIWDKLVAGDALLFRYRDTAEPTEGAFVLCSLWAVEVLAMGAGSLADAVDLFERVLMYGNDLGLFGEEIEPATGATLGNFPQAFTHIGVVNAALALERRRIDDANPGGDS